MRHLELKRLKAALTALERKVTATGVFGEVFIDDGDGEIRSVKERILACIRQCMPAPIAECENPDCDEETCQECCDHDYDPNEGMMCLNCGKEYPF